MEQQLTYFTTAGLMRVAEAQVRAVDALLRDPLWSLLADEAIASIVEVSPGEVRAHRRTVGDFTNINDGCIACLLPFLG